MSGYMIVQKSASTHGTNLGAQAPCPLGTKAVGGGSEVTSGVSVFGPFLVASYPDASGFNATYQLAASSPLDISITIYAVCVTLPT
jgi:hypothetical protein